MVLERYTDQIIDYATNPISGIQRVSKWPPSIAEVVSHCDAEVERLAKIKRYRDMGNQSLQPRPTQHRANVWVPPADPRYQELVAKARTADEREYRYDQQRGGIWVGLGWLDEARSMPVKFASGTPAEPWVEATP